MSVTFRFDDVLVSFEQEQMLAQIQAYRALLASVREKRTYDMPESSILAPDDEALLSSVIAVRDSVCGSEIKHVFIAGIGGSSLGARAVYQALGQGSQKSSPTLHFLESPDFHMFELLERTVFNTITDAGAFAIVVISKSGTTTETTAIFRWLCEKLGVLIGESLHKRIIVISDTDSPLAVEARTHKWQFLSIPKPIGGRFSIFTPAGLLPLACAGVDIRAFSRGAVEGREEALAEYPNPYMISALIDAIWFLEGRTIMTLFLGDARLTGVGAWYRQLVAESLGKPNREGRPIAFLPDIALLPEDLHSVAQLYFGALNQQATTFLSVSGAHPVTEAIHRGVCAAYQTSKKPFITTELSSLDASCVGAWMQGMMIKTMYLGTLLNVDTFTQPDVERYKEETRRILASGV